MTGASNDKIARAHAKLTALRANLSNHHEISQIYVDEFHHALKHLEDLGYDLQEFKIPHSQVRPIVTSGNYLTGKVNYSEDSYVSGQYFLMKLDAVLAYLNENHNTLALKDRAKLEVHNEES